MKKRGFFITFEGTDGVGKSTQAALLADWLREKGLAVQQTREPGGGEAAERIRQILLDPDLKISGLAELFLYEAARVEHLDRVIRPALAAGHVVLCDRFTDSTLAYQGFARNLMKEAVLLNRVAAGGLKPDLTLLLDLPAADGLRKAVGRTGGGGDRLENEGAAFQETVRKGFVILARKEPRRIRRIAVRATVDETQAEIRRAVAKRFSL